MYSKEKIMNILHEIKNESNEIGPYVIFGQPRRSAECPQAQNLDGHFGLHVDVHGFSHGYVETIDMPVDSARNYIIQRVLETNAEYLFFVGDDTVSPYHAFKTLLKTSKANPDAVVVGVYYIKLSDAMIMIREDDKILVPDVSPGQVFEAWQTGMDCMLIPTKILRKMYEEEPELPFCCIANNIGGIPFVGEDNFFVHRLRKHGFRLLVDTNVQCLHMDVYSGKYTAHPDINLKEYFTNIPITGRLTMHDKEELDKKWAQRTESLTKKFNENYKIQNKILDSIQNGNSLKLNIGSGRDKLDGYISIDKYDNQADINEDFLETNIPFNTAEEILASHVIEHIPHHRGPEFLKKCFDVLKSSGKLILELPDLEELCKKFVETEDDKERYWLTVCMYGVATGEEIPTEYTIKNGTKSPHLWGYYPKVMKDILSEIGYSHIKILPPKGEHMGANFRVEAIKE